MDRTIELTREAFNGLAAHLAEDSGLVKVFRNVDLVHGPDNKLSWVISCSQADIEDLLEIAKRHCPEAVPQLESAIRKYREQ